jgi:hypothetical protein
VTRSSLPSGSQIRARTYEAYEAVRAQIIGSAVAAPVRGVGLALLLQHGVAAWLQAVCTCIIPSSAVTATPSRVTTDDEPRTRSLDAIPSEQHAEVTTLLAGLVLSARPMGRNPTLYSGGCA